MVDLTLGASAHVTTLGLYPLGYNIGAIHYWTEPRFINMARHGEMKRSPSEPAVDGDLTADGYFKKIPTGYSDCLLIFRSGGTANTQAYLNGNVKISWDGDGDIEGDGTGLAEVALTNGGTVAFTDASTGTTNLKFTRINEADPIRNIRIIHEDNQADFDAGKMFIQSTAAVNAAMGGARFMDWQATNGSTKTVWADRVPADFCDQSDTALENCIQFANECYALNNKFRTAWFCLPHLSDATYQINTLEMIRDTLNPKIIARIEFSNELFNTQFSQTQSMADQANAEWGLSQDKWGDAKYSMQGKKSVELGQRVISVFAETGQTNYKNVLGGWQAGQIKGTLVRNAPLWLDSGDEDYVVPSSLAHAWAITTYFVHTIGADTGIVTAYEAEANDALGQAAAVAYMNSITGADIESTKSYYAAHSADAAAAGLDLEAYEGGTHVVATAANTGLWTGGQLKTWVLEVFTTYDYSTEMAAFENTNRDNWKAAGGKLLMEYLDYGIVSKSGIWGRRQYYGDTNPVGASIGTWQTANPKWWLG